MARADVLRVVLPSPGGHHEQAGRRPAIAVQADTRGINLPTLMIVPVTGELTALRFPYTVRVDPSKANGLTMPSALLVFQLRAIDRARIIETIGRLEPEYVERLDAELRRMLNL